MLGIGHNRLAEILLRYGAEHLPDVAAVRALDEQAIMDGLNVAASVVCDIANLIGRSGAYDPNSGLLQSVQRIVALAQHSASLEERLTVAEGRLAERQGPPVAVTSSSAADVFALIEEVLPGTPSAHQTTNQWIDYAARVDVGRQIARWGAQRTGE